MIPSSFLDLLLLVFVFCVVRPIAGLLVYVELSVRMALLTVTATAATALEVPFATAYTVALGGRDAVAGVAAAVLPSPVCARALRFACAAVAWLQRTGEGSSINGQPVYLDEVAGVAAATQAERAAAAAMAAAESATPWTRMVLNFRERIYHARDLLSTILSPTLMLRMVPLLGKPLTGDAHRFRRKLCEKSLIYRMCVHFL